MKHINNMDSSKPNDYGIDFSTGVEPLKPQVTRTHFRNKPLEARKRKYESLMSREENVNRIPIICELHEKSQLYLRTDLKFLTHEKMTLKSFQGSVRKKMNFQDDTVLFFYHGKKIMKNDQSLGELYHRLKAEDGFLYLQFSEIKALG